MARKKQKYRLDKDGKYIPQFRAFEPAKGRASGTKNLIKTSDGGYINVHGVKFSDADKRALESAVNSANRYRKKQISETANIERIADGKPTGQTIGELRLMGQESDFIISKRSKSLQRFTSREQFENYLDSTRKINTGEWLEDKTRLYKANMRKALGNVYGDEAKDISMKIQMMKPADFRKLIMENENLEISYQYLPSERTAKLNQLRRTLGMKEKDFFDDIDEE